MTELVGRLVGQEPRRPLPVDGRLALPPARDRPGLRLASCSTSPASAIGSPSTHLAGRSTEAGRLEAELVERRRAAPSRYDLMVDDLRAALDWARTGRPVGQGPRARPSPGPPGVRPSLRRRGPAALPGRGRAGRRRPAKRRSTCSTPATPRSPSSRARSASAATCRRPRTPSEAVTTRPPPSPWPAPASWSTACRPSSRSCPSAELVAGHMETAYRLGRGQGELVAAHLAVAEAWMSGGEPKTPTLATAAEAAVRAARAVGDPVLESSAMDALSAGAWAESALRESVQIALDRSRNCSTACDRTTRVRAPSRSTSSTWPPTPSWPSATSPGPSRGRSDRCTTRCGPVRCTCSSASWSSGSA